MAEKKLNHYIPRLILKNWVTTNDENRKGVYVFDTKKNKSYFSEAEGKRAFSFAIGNDLYVPKINDERRLELEDWFGGLENTSANAIRKIASNENEPLFSNRDETVKFAMALMSFKYRTKFVIEKMSSYLEENPEYLKLIRSRLDNNKELIILEHIVNATTHATLELSHFEMIAWKSNNKSLIFGDVPFLDNVADGYSFMPITNKIFISLRSIMGESRYTILECEDEMIHSLNLAIASNSVNWIIADNISQIEEYEPELKNNIDRGFVYTPLKFPMRGSTFR